MDCPACERILFYALTYNDDRQTLASIGMAEGIGFFVLENILVLTEHMDDIDISWAACRVIGMVHAQLR